VVVTSDRDALATMRSRFASEPDTVVRKEMALAFGALRDQEALPVLLGDLRSGQGDEPERQAALASIEFIGGEPAREGLLGLLREERLEPARQPRVIAALGRFKARTAVPTLLEKLASPFAPVRAAAAEALGKIGQRDGVGTRVTSLLGDPDLDVRKAAIAALADLDERDAIPALLNAAAAEPTEFEASLALARLPDTRALQVYLRGLAHKNPDLRKSSATALSGIRDQAAVTLDQLASRRELSPALLPELRRVFTTPEQIRNWHVVGPFPIRERPPLDPRQKMDLGAELKGRGGKPVRWKPAQASDEDGSLDLEQLISGDSDLAAFAYAEFTSASARSAELVISSDDTCTVWLNSKRVFQFRGERNFEHDQNRVEVSLAAGTNRVLVQCGNLGGAWRFAVAVTRPGDYAFLKAPDPAQVGFDPDLFRTQALEGKGKADRGRAVFLDPKGIGCIKCHAVAGQGGTVGPELSSVGAKYSRDELIASVLFPSARISSGYEATIVATTDGRVLTGLVKSDTPETLELADQAAQLVRIPKAEIDARKPGTLSIMPNGLAAGLSSQEFADLIAYLESLKEAPAGGK
ncbi:MAG TPA: HEAT repeat domain-containing protein, partial [Isosphaeraceae bacterium]|nr:HEAT repeat domain-containing protein [Isosphaeraceae bacterium]